MTLVAESGSRLEPEQDAQFGIEYAAVWHGPQALSYTSDVDCAIVPTRLAAEIVALGIPPDAQKTGSSRGEADLASLATSRVVDRILTIHAPDGDNDVDRLVGYVLLTQDRFRRNEYRTIKYLFDLAVFDSEHVAGLLTQLGIVHPDQVPSEEDFA